MAFAALMCAGTPARGAWMIPPSPYRPKDFAVVKKDGVYHLFYIERNTGLPASETENDFGHATSYDLTNWTQQPPVLATRPSSWDNLHVWAPSIVELHGVYYLFYAGVTETPGTYNTYQRIGVATSTNLFDWTRADAPVFSCNQVPGVYCDSLDALTGFRDPFVMPDPGTPGRWLMYYTANVAGDSTNEIVGVASSDSTFTHWSDLRQLGVTYRPTTNSGSAESPHLFQHDGLWYLLFTANGIQPIAFATSPDPTADASGWTWRGRLGDMLGFYTGSWFASEYLRDGLNEYLFYVNADRIEYYQMEWTGEARFTLASPDPFHVTGMAWEADTVMAGHPASLRIASVNWWDRRAPIETLTLDSLGNATPIWPDSVGLLTSIPITADTLHWSWSPKLWPSGTTQPMRLLVRMQDQTAATSSPVVVLPDTSPAAPDPFRVTSLFWSTDTLRRGTPVTLGIVASRWAEHTVPFAIFTGEEENLTPAPLDSLGFPPTLELVSDTTRFNWTSRTWPDSEGGPRLSRIVVRIAGDTLETRPALIVLPDSVAGPSPPPWPSGTPEPGDDVGLKLRNPMRSATGSTTAFSVHAPVALAGRLDLFDLQGRRVAAIADRVFPRGTSVISWNGRRSDGSAAQAGIYFARLTTARGTRTARTVVLP